jgi:predicted membrane protein
MSRVISRVISLALALSASGVLSIAPFMLARNVTGTVHGVLVVLMLGVSAAFIHGVGFVPRTRLVGLIASPMIAWPLILSTATGLLLSR